MSSLAKLSIRGVRAFSPDDEEQIVEFFFPFTIIVGQNGCGKTTIIECLKYAITGGLPPGTKSGQAFVHDPRQSGSKQTKATVKLRFNSRSGQPTVVVRSMELTQNKSTLSFKQLDGVIRTSDPVTGARNTLSHKCSDLDTTLPTMLGISKSILDNVLFCHQEEANWPLMEGAVLKKKFDDIFDSTRYTKAVEVFRKKEKELLSKCKDIKVDLAAFQGTKNAVDGYEKELRQINEAEENLSEERKDYKEKIVEIDKEIAYYDAIVDKIGRAEQELMQMQGLIDQHQATLKRQQSMVEQDLSDTHSMEDINQMLRGFDVKLKDEISKRDDLESNIQSLNAKIDSLHQNEMELKTKMGKLASEKEAHESRLKDRIRMMESIASAYNFNLQEVTQTQHTNTSLDDSMNNASQSIETEKLIEISADEMQGFFRRTEEILKALNDDLKAHKEKNQSEEDVIQKYLIELGGELGALEKDKEEITRQKREYRDELNDLNKEINSMSRFRRSEVEEAKRNAEKLAKERDAANSSTRLKDIEIDIRRIEDEWDSLKRKQSTLKEELDAARESADAQTAIVTLEEEFARELEMLQESVKDYSSMLCRFNLQDLEKLPSFAGDGQPIVEHIDHLGIDIRDRLNEANARLTDSTGIYKKDESSVSEKTWSLRGAQKSLQNLQQQYNYLNCNDVEVLRRVVDHIRQFDPSFTIDETMPNELRDHINNKIAEYDDVLDVLADPTIIKGVVKKLFMSFRNTEDPKCPCCMQNLDSSEKLETFKERYRLMSSAESPLLVDSEEAEFQRSQRAKFQEWRKVVDEKIMKVSDFLRIKADIEKCDKDIRDGEDELSSLKQKLNQRKEDLEDCKAEAADLEELAKASDRWKDSSLRIGQRALIIQNKRKDMNILTNTFTTLRDRRIVDQEYSKLTEELENLGNRKSELNAEATKINQFCSQIAQQALNAENRARELASKFADSEKATARKNEIYELQKQLLEKERHVDRDIPSLRLRIQERDSEKQRIRHEGSIEERKLLQFLQDFENTLSRLGTLTYQIDSYTSSDKLVEHQTVQSTLDHYAEEVQVCKEELSSIKPRLDTIRTFINDQERQKRQLEYNIQLIEEKNSLVELMERFASKKRELENIEHYAIAKEELRRLSNSKAKLVEKKTLADGRYQEIMSRHRSLVNQLNREEYNTIDKKLLKAKIEYDTTHLAAEDLKKYQNALDAALLQFHAKKLAEINKIIRELWLMTYKGEDITNIELQSGQEPGSRAQRSYNYRVVMSKGTTELDMRGRCSAGQRVLACIVIRLALAESFGVNCGCIALDEPTVNLDYENKKGLAIALAQIVVSRSQQRNFQLILITHDEEFVSMMKTELAALTGFSMPEVYFQVFREEGPDGKLYSKIQAVDWDNL